MAFLNSNPEQSGIDKPYASHSAKMQNKSKLLPVQNPRNIFKKNKYSAA
jgi:hypothetical protein